MFTLSLLSLLIGCGEQENTRKEFENLPPFSAVISLEPAAPTTIEDLTVEIIKESIDLNDDPVTLRFEWYLNDELQADLTEESISADLTTVGDVWTVSVIANDGSLDSAESRRSVTIRNSAPTVSASLQWVDVDGTVMTELEAPGTDADLASFGGYNLQVVADGSDIDEEALTYTYEWTVDGTALSLEEDTLDAASMDRGQEWVVSVTANDGLSNSESFELSFSFYNAIPMMDSVSLMPEMPYLGDSIECMASATDADDTELTYAYTWTITAGVDEEGNAITSTSTDNPLDTTELLSGNTVQCTAVASDGRDDSESIMTEPMTLVVNTAPVINSVSIDTSVDTAFTCSAVYSDAETAMEDLMVTYTWTDSNGASLADGETLDSTAHAPGQVTCTVLVSDGNLDTSSSTTAEIPT